MFSWLTDYSVLTCYVALSLNRHLHKFLESLTYLLGQNGSAVVLWDGNILFMKTFSEKIL